MSANDHLTETEYAHGYRYRGGYVERSMYPYWLRFVTRGDVERFRGGHQPRLLTARWYFRSPADRAAFLSAMCGVPGHVVAAQTGKVVG
jgi:hypothetical protein